MILQSLHKYYDRLRSEPQNDIPQTGFSRQGIHFCITLDLEGNMVGDPIDLRDGNKPKYLTVPQAVKRSSGIAANFLWDNTGYVLGADKKGKAERLYKTFDAFKTLQHTIGNTVQDDRMQALLSFLDSWQPENAESLPLWDEMAGLNVVFKIDGETAYIHDSPAIRDAWLTHAAPSSNDMRGMCLVTGNGDAPISRLHPSIKGIPGTQTSGAALISFNLPAFNSLNKSQNLNAPVSEQATFTYTTALNHLLRRESFQKVQIGDATTVFWTEESSPVESLMAGLFDPDFLESAPDQLQADLKIFLESVSQGQYPKSFDNPENRFYILGLSPNAARISVRFWHVSTTGKVAKRIGRHYRDIALVKCFERDPDYPSIWQILRETAAQRDSRNISPILSGQLLRSLIEGTYYPRTLLSAIISRIRADKQINYTRIAMLKAFLIRNHQMEVTMSLNTESSHQGYRLGRLFAVLEKAQQEAIPGANATIKDRYFGAASATPGRIFPVLIRGAQNNISKLRKSPDTKGRAIHFDRLISDIMDGINQFQPTLYIEDQGMFAIGYYHQRKDLFTSKNATTEIKED